MSWSIRKEQLRECDVTDVITTGSLAILRVRLSAAWKPPPRLAVLTRLNSVDNNMDRQLCSMGGCRTTTGAFSRSSMQGGKRVPTNGWNLH